MIDTKESVLVNIISDKLINNTLKLKRLKGIKSKKILLNVLKTLSVPVYDMEKEFLTDKDVALNALTRRGNSLSFFESFKNNKEIVLCAVKNDGMALQFASEELKNDEDVVMCAVKNNGLALQFANARLKVAKKL